MSFDPAQWAKALSEQDRNAVLQVFVPRVDGAGDVQWKRRDDRAITDNEAAAANKALRTLAAALLLVVSRKHRNRKVPLPASPPVGALRTWHLHRHLNPVKDRWPCEALAAPGSDVYDSARTTSSRWWAPAGMGEVYRAMDTRLHRDVAIKVLPDLFANNLERLARFQIFL